MRELTRPSISLTTAVTAPRTRPSAPAAPSGHGCPCPLHLRKAEENLTRYRVSGDNKFGRNLSPGVKVYPVGLLRKVQDRHNPSPWGLVCVDCRAPEGGPLRHSRAHLGRSCESLNLWIITLLTFEVTN